MSTITLRRVPPELRERLKEQAAQKGLSLNSYLLELCRTIGDTPRQGELAPRPPEQRRDRRA